MSEVLLCILVFLWKNNEIQEIKLWWVQYEKEMNIDGIGWFKSIENFKWMWIFLQSEKVLIWTKFSMWGEEKPDQKSRKLLQSQLEQLTIDAIPLIDLWFFYHRCNANYIIEKINNLLTPCGILMHDPSKRILSKSIPAGNSLWHLNRPPKLLTKTAHPSNVSISTHW